ncbi:hypothetical protein B566_EDAN007564 [Ephemera danica]|nr:hypothetical protein B566_EDAN007564 [Ephemera danica]
MHVKLCFCCFKTHIFQDRAISSYNMSSSLVGDAAETTVNIFESIKKYLDQKLLNEARSVTQSADFIACLSEHAGELLSIITSYLRPNHELDDPSSLIACCEDILCEIAKNAMPEEIFFELLDKIDGQACDTMVVTLLKPFDITLHRLPSKRVQSLEWFYSSLLDNFKEMDQLDVKQLSTVFNKIDAFTSNFILELNTCDDDSDAVNRPNSFFAGNKKKGQEVISNFLLNGLALLAPSNSYPLLVTLLYYMIFCQGVASDKFPCVYSQEYIFHCTISLSCGLMGHEETDMHRKGLALLRSGLERVCPHSISHVCLSSPTHSKLFQSISNIMVFNPSKEVRQEAVPLLRRYIESFDSKGRHLFLTHAINASEQQGVTAYLITLIKEFSLEYINNKDQNYFRNNLPQLICAACQIPKINGTALFDVSDQAITALSLIRFFSMKDPKPETLGTGIWQLESKLKTSFLIPLSNMLEKSRNAVRQQLSDAECLKDTKKDSKQPEFSVDVQGSLLAMPKYEEEVAALKAKLITLDLIEMRLDIAKEGWGM